ncbi:MAG: hypothetical protein AAFU78_17595, partial [Cyanobacteria bacterium J06633_2]
SVSQRIAKRLAVLSSRNWRRLYENKAHALAKFSHLSRKNKGFSPRCVPKPFVTIATSCTSTTGTAPALRT